MSRNGDLTSHRENRRKPADQLAEDLSAFWAHVGDDDAPVLTATDDEMAVFLIARGWHQ